MGVFGLSQVCALLLAGMIGVEGATFPQNGPQDRVLRAATRRSDLSRRSLRIGKKFESEIIYIEEENIWSPKPVFASKVKVDSKKPILNLEHIEHHLEDVHCGDGSMRLHFRDHMAARDAKAACHGEDGGLIITSHSGCNKDGERAVYKVHKSSFSEDGQALELTVVESLWKESFDTFDISFGHTEDDLFYRRHPDFQKLRRRQNEEPKKEKEEEEKKEGETKEGENKEGKGKGVEIPTDTPDDVNTATFDLKYEVVDKTFSVDDFLSSTYLDQVVNTPNLPNIPIEVGCKKCTTTGKLVLTQGNIKINVDEIDLVPDVFSVEASDNKNETIQAAKKDTGSIISGGFIELASKNMGGRFELFARPQQTGSLSIGLPPLPAIGFVIPGVGKAGVSFESSLNLDFEIVKGLDISYGAEMSIPDGTIRLELADVTKSGVNGFKKATIKALPFKSNLTDIDLLVGVAFNPSIPIGFEFADKLEATVTVDMELPRLDARIRTKKNVDANCDPLKKKTKEADTKEVEVESVEALAKKIGPLVLIESNVSVSVDVNLELALPLLPAPFDGIGTAANIFTTQFALPTTCLAPGNGYAIASKVFSAPVKPKVTGGPEAQAEMTPPPAGQSPGAEQTPAPCSTGVPPPPPPDAPAPPCDCGTVTVYVPPTNAPMPPPPPGAPAPPPENPEVPPEGPNTPPPENPQAPPPENPQAPPPENPQAPPPENPQAPPPENPQAPPPENPQAPPPENPQAPPPENPQAPPPENPQAPPPENPAKPPCTTTGVPPPPPPPVLNTTCTGNVTTAPPPPPETPTPPPAETPSAPPPADTPIVTDPAPTPTAPTGGVTAPTGFMDPGTPSGPPTTSSTEPLEFDNAAVPRAVSAMDMGTIGWQAGLLITSFGIGAMML